MQEMLRTLMLLENTKTDFVMKPFANLPQALGVFTVTATSFLNQHK